MTQPISPASLDELRRLMHLDWANEAVDGRPPLVDIDRAANLYGVVADPYHRLAFGNFSRSHLMLICIYGLLENRQWDKACRAIARLDRMERDRVRQQPVPGPVTNKTEPAPPPPAPPAATAAPAAPASDPPVPAGSLPRAVMQAMSTDELFAFCAGQIGLSPADFQKQLETAAPFT